MLCPECYSEFTDVVDSRMSDGERRRRRLCADCGNRFTTFEVSQKFLNTHRNLINMLPKLQVVGQDLIEVTRYLMKTSKE